MSRSIHTNDTSTHLTSDMFTGSVANSKGPGAGPPTHARGAALQGSSENQGTQPTFPPLLPQPTEALFREPDGENVPEEFLYKKSSRCSDNPLGNKDLYGHRSLVASRTGTAAFTGSRVGTVRSTTSGLKSSMIHVAALTGARPPSPRGHMHRRGGFSGPLPPGSSPEGRPRPKFWSWGRPGGGHLPVTTRSPGRCTAGQDQRQSQDSVTQLGRHDHKMSFMCMGFVGGVFFHFG